VTGSAAGTTGSVAPVASPPVESPPTDATTPATDQHGPVGRWLLWPLAIGVVLVVFADPLVDLAVRVLPGRMRLRSLGTNFDSFDEVGADIVARTGWVLLAACGVAVVAGWLRARDVRPTTDDRRIHFALTGALVVATAAWYGWLATPHNAFPSNARFHWVDYITWDTDDYFYALGRIPHRIFYDAPWMWQSINAALAVWLCYLIARRIGCGRGMSTALASLIALSGNLLLFANSAEDVLLNVTLMLLLLYASLRRVGWFVGLALLLLILGRPSFSVVALALPIGELLVALRHRRRPTRQQVVYVATAAAVTAVGVLVTQIYFTIAGRRYFLTEGRLVYVPELDGVTPREVDGFTLSAWSGAFATHLLWVIPVFVLVGAIAAAVVARRQEVHVEATVYLAVSGALLLVVVLESNPLLYYNVRYLTYLLPLLAVAAWSLLAPGVIGPADSGRAREPVVTPAVVTRAFVAAALVLGPLVFPADPVGIKRAIEQRDELELLDVNTELRELAEGRTVFLTFGSSSTRNYVSYVLRSNPNDIKLPGDSGPGLVIARREDAPAGVEPLLETDSFVVYLDDG
jgi:hypothetical protein